MFKRVQSNQVLFIAVALVAFAGLIAAGYFTVTHRQVDASISLYSSPIPSEPSPLHKGMTFRVAVAAMLSPLEGFKAYRELADLIAHEFGLPLELVTRDTYAEINDLLRAGEVDVAFVCTGGYASAPEAMDVIAAPVINGHAEYNALIIVPSDSEARKFSDLKGASFLFTDPDSNTGSRYPRLRVADFGESVDTFFGNIRYTGSHDRSIQAVSQRLSDAASVDSLVYHYMAKKDGTLRKRVRIIEKSPPYPSPPVVVRKTLSIHYRNHLVRLLESLPNTESGREILREIGIDGFTPASNHTYRSLFKQEAK